ncbi:MAG: 30S ribosome-binding factor RbfA [Candidatus Sumerlaeia bacterium]|nr:30S ribosome-binding factor RbfA [Candidatus Sumerlaeia bacterium]
MALHSRLLRVEELVAHTLAELLLKEVKDERLRMANVTHVKISKDLRHALVAVSCLSDDAADRRELLAGLERAKGWLRHELGQRVRMKYLPDLRFVLDTSAAYAAHIEELLHEALPEETSRADAEPKD